MPALRPTASGLLFALMALAASPAGLAQTVALVLSESGGAYAEVAHAIRRELSGAFELTQRLAGEPERAPRAAQRIVVAIGTEACRRAAQEGGRGQSVLCTLVPKAAFHRIAESARGGGVALGAVLLDQPIARQMALIRLALPEHRRIAVLLGPDSASLAGPLASAATAAGLQPRIGRLASAEELPEVLQRTLGDADVLLAVPDATVFNARTIQNILRTAYKNRIPLVAFSPAYVHAGAVVALYSTPAQIGRQTARAVRALTQGRDPRKELPLEFDVAVNAYVARSLGIELPEGEALAERLRRAEGTR